MLARMLTPHASRRLPAFFIVLGALAVGACGAKGDLMLPKAGGGPPPAATSQQPSTRVPIQPAIPSPPPIPPETAPSTTPKQP
jgi:predicted small lipoprotein YifL